MAAKPLSQLIRIELNNIRIAIIGSQLSLGLRDRGISANSFTINVTNEDGELIGAEYIQTNYDDVGIKPMKGRIGGLVAGLTNWTKLKPEEGESKLQAAFRVATAIRAKGSLIFRGKRGIDIDKIIENSADRFEKAVADNEEQRIEDDLNNIIR